MGAAAEVFVEEGYAGATIEQVAARAGVSRPTVFAVGSKAQLFALARQRGGHRRSPDHQRRRLPARSWRSRTRADCLRSSPPSPPPYRGGWGRCSLCSSKLQGPIPSWHNCWNQASRNCLQCARGIVAAVAATGSLRRDIPRERCRRRAMAADPAHELPAPGGGARLEPPRVRALACRGDDRRLAGVLPDLGHIHRVQGQLLGSHQCQRPAEDCPAQASSASPRAPTPAT